MSGRGFLTPIERLDLIRTTRNGLEEDRVSQRANAILLLDEG
jgi:hypothetical protein